MFYVRDRSHRLGGLLLSGSVLMVPAAIFFPRIAWMAAAGILVLASLSIMAVGIRAFVGICLVSLGHFIVVGPPPPYGRGDHPVEFLLLCVFLPLTLAAASIGVWHWRDEGRKMP